MKQIYLLLFSLLGTCACFAQSAETILSAASAAYEQSNGITAQFTSNIQNEKQGGAESFEGIIQMKGDKFVLATPDARTWYDGKTQWTYMPSAGEVYVSTPTGDELQLTNPMVLLRSYKKDYNLTYIGESTSDKGKTAYDIRLAAKRQNDVNNIEIQIDKTTSLPVRITVLMKNGIRNLIRIGSMQTDVNQPDTLFSFNPADFPDAVEIDLR
ncbi:MAG: outer-membrane lipoprotein carrier protein LolA [Tannerella sp.]|jgi:outer membrane lipoprotein-sorting protein|nr:outer-membrane lipoprotein carrier protein LolA [Tannerella sp.]